MSCYILSLERSSPKQKISKGLNWRHLWATSLAKEPFQLSLGISPTCLISTLRLTSARWSERQWAEGTQESAPWNGALDCGWLPWGFWPSHLVSLSHNLTSVWRLTVAHLNPSSSASTRTGSSWAQASQGGRPDPPPRPSHGPQVTTGTPSTLDSILLQSWGSHFCAVSRFQMYVTTTKPNTKSYF